MAAITLSEINVLHRVLPQQNEVPTSARAAPATTTSKICQRNAWDDPIPYLSNRVPCPILGLGFPVFRTMFCWVTIWREQAVSTSKFPYRKILRMKSLVESEGPGQNFRPL